MRVAKRLALSEATSFYTGRLFLKYVSISTKFIVTEDDIKPLSLIDTNNTFLSPRPQVLIHVRKVVDMFVVYYIWPTKFVIADVCMYEQPIHITHN